VTAPSPSNSARLEALHQDLILDHYRRPRNKGRVEAPDAEGGARNPLCGDELTVTLAIDESGRVAEARFTGAGCSISQASASVMTDLVIGKPVDDAMGVHEEFLRLMQSKGEGEPDEDILEDAVAFAGVSRYPARIKCALLAWMAWKDATAQAMAEES
jgi:nitrogen fixation NifU-like protein